MSTSSIPLWGQAWELTVQYQTSTGTESVTVTTNGWEPEALRMTFEVMQSTIRSPWWYADIVIYNLNDQTLQNILFNATWATLKAGFQNGSNLYSVIWDGYVLQTLFDRENVVDQCLILHCIAMPGLDDVISFSVGEQNSQLQLVARMAQEINLPPIGTQYGTVGPQAAQLMAKQYPRGNTVFGKMSKFMGQIADDNLLQTWYDGKQTYISEMNNQSLTPALNYSPPFPPGYTASMLGLPADVTQSIIGTPRQTPFGVIFTVLLDPRLKVQLPPMVVALHRTVIAQLMRSPDPNSQFVTPYANDLSFFVGKVTHRGDTRGNTWETEVVGYSTTYGPSLLDGVFAAKAGT